ncbi:MAG: hypothetical protein DRN20_05610 [Thermoplasmata archaeon]|nr:MAG: hypothetical protein DRN20_05610 [Thermoplasmata archaeon]
MVSKEHAEVILRGMYKTLGNAVGSPVVNKIVGNLDIENPINALSDLRKKLEEVFGESTVKNMLYVVITSSFDNETAQKLLNELQISIGEST